MSDGPVDRAAMDGLADQFGGGDEGREFVRELTETFLEDTPVQLATLRGAVEQGDAEEAHRAAHSMKSNGATLGARSFAALCAELEALAREGALDGVEGLLGRAEEEWILVEDALGPSGGGDTQ